MSQDPAPRPLRQHVAQGWPVLVVGLCAALVALAAAIGVWHVQARADATRLAEARLSHARAGVIEAGAAEVLSRLVPADSRDALRPVRARNASEAVAAIDRARPAIGAEQADALRRDTTRLLDALAEETDARLAGAPLATAGALLGVRLLADFREAQERAAATADEAARRAQRGTPLFIALAALAFVGLSALLRSLRRRVARGQGGGPGSDPLTGLPGRHHFDTRVAAAVREAVERGEEVSLALIDVDRLKRVNDLSGPSAGDDVLIEVGRRLATAARTVDTVARLGADEFAWLLPGADSVRAWEAADRARRAIGEAMAGRGGVTISLGVCALSDAGTATELVRCADRALHDAKRRGRDTAVCFVPDLSHAPADGGRGDRRRYFGGSDSA